MLPLKAVIATAHKTPEGVVSLESDPIAPYRAQNMTVPPTQLKSVLTFWIISTVCWLIGSLLLTKSSVPLPHSFLYTEGWLTFHSRAHPTIPACCGPSRDLFCHRQIPQSSQLRVITQCCRATKEWSYEVDNHRESRH